MKHHFPICFASLLMFVLCSTGQAEVNRVQITTRQDVLQGRQFGAAGAYEWLAGRAYFTLDPADTANTAITDLRLAPRDAKGLVEFSAELVVLKPKDTARANGVVLLDVVNRGRPTILAMLNRGATGGLSPGVASSFGDGFLMNQGYTIVLLGWEQDLPSPPDLLHLYGPIITGVTGLVYTDIQLPTRAADAPIANRGTTPYPVADADSPENRLTMRASSHAPETLIPRDQWSFGPPKGISSANSTHLYVKGGFAPGVVYRIVYLAKDPYVAGLGLAAVRDLISWIRFEPTSLIHATHAYAFGESQSGRFLRQFLHDGFNADLAAMALT